ncbi:MAG TPA: ubiquinone/menaquinone biosynthesis methyltransferase [Anaerolineales bacterium]|nr:ubiquinone/menaquinone biosynthesis methyltransferase [Anaerolineales bacterium]
MKGFQNGLPSGGKINSTMVLENKPILPKNAAEFQTQQDDVFGRIAGRYDLLCDLFSLGIHRLWKRRVAKIIAGEPWSQLLDSATGTGDIILRMFDYNADGSDHKIVASDISPQMLNIARKRLIHKSSQVEFYILDAHKMPEINDSSIDLYSISLGLKICQREQVLREAIRVLRPGGRLVILEASNIPWNWLHNLYLSYMRFCMPIIGWIATRGDTSAYRYLLKGIENFPSAEDLAKEISSVGFDDVSFERLSLGIVAIHVARKPDLIN